MPVIPIRPIRISGNTAIITLSRGVEATVDISDAERVGKFNWYASKIKRSTYAVRDIRKDGLKKPILLHRFILSAPDGMQVDHINGDGLDNRSCNLRLATHQENCLNSRTRRDNKSGHKGVCFDKIRNKWSVEIHFKNEKMRLGRFVEKEDAINAYRSKAVELFGEFINFG